MVFQKLFDRFVTELMMNCMVSRLVDYTVEVLGNNLKATLNFKYEYNTKYISTIVHEPNQ